MLLKICKVAVLLHTMGDFLSQCMKFSYSNLLCLIAKVSTKREGGGEIFPNSQKWWMKMQLFGSNI